MQALRSSLLFLFLSSASALTFNVDPSKEECLFEDIQSGTKVSGSFQVSTGGFLDIDCKVSGPDDRAIYSVKKETEGRFTYIAHETGVYRFCFSNVMSTVTPKTVSFTLVVGEPNKSQVAKSEHVTPLEKSVLALSEGLAQIQAEQEYMRMRERAHRNTSESTNARVLWWSLIEAGALILMSAIQIFYLRRFFETKSRV
mmetsp:Transcript_39741/g.94194  ORF Transcript_39741/g.94194 Transcript_39741/m.94194 type:complete len:199 (+) Transcript_39741:102-698(+)|eukprot:CAMPEP_0177719192 /NCGR_PEP_ID=MMETSP0484_2-20121128/15975_1 /TAXON_ID=354590 /ORGANISM="Rhodomonas lens, Strain RHODO" /LENGTH=198 /DNA_ID=CAMNT_0019231399 /DNA_START=92 /DNA_END=688 /DNA_ORIENTATION=-